MPGKEHVKCDLCGADEPKPHLEVGGHTFVECDKCGFIYQNPRPPRSIEEVTEGTIEGLTEKGYRESRQWYYRRILKELGKFREKGRLLEVGCASGGFLQAARDAGWEAVGVEISRQLAGIARERGLEVRICDICEADFPAESFDVAVMNMVIEHVPSPREVILKVREFLRPGGAIWMHTPNYASTAIRMSPDGYNYPGGHFCCFTPATLTRLCNECELEILYSKTTGFRFPGRRKGWRKPFEKLASLVLSRLGKGHRLRVLAVKEAR